jgi:outer membrane lipoprotein-sorting protein
MKRLFALTAVAVVLASLVVLPGYAQTSKDAQNVLNKMIDAQGGRKYLETLKDTTTTGSAELVQMGISGTVTLYQKEPNKMRMDMEFMGMVITQAYNGEKAWFTNPQTGATEELPEGQAKELARQALGTESLLNPEKFGITYALLPKAKLDSTEYIVLEQTMADGHKSVLYVDPSTDLPYKVETTGLGQSGEDVKIESYQTDYKKVGQSMVAHSIRTLQDGADFMHFTITKVEYNTGLDDALFTLVK